jgi:hypothetical protein
MTIELNSIHMEGRLILAKPDARQNLSRRDTPTFTKLIGHDSPPKLDHSPSVTVLGFRFNIRTDNFPTSKPVDPCRKLFSRDEPIPFFVITHCHRHS